MAKKRKKKEEKYYGKSEDEWREWGEEFGQRMGRIGEEFGRRMEKRGREWEREGRTWWYRTFGFIGPLIGSIFGILLIAIAIIALRILNVIFGSSFIAAIAGFLFTYLPLLFAISLFYGYNEYFSKRFWKHYWAVSPITTGVSIVIALWFAAWALNLLNTIPKSSVVTSVASFISINLWGFFAIFLVAGYVIVAINKFLPIFARY